MKFLNMETLTPVLLMIFCIAFFQYQQGQQAFLDEGLLFISPSQALSCWNHALILWSPSPLESRLSSTTSLFPLVGDAPAGLLDDTQKAVACMISLGHRLGISINTSEGKTEAMIHLVGPHCQRHPFRALHDQAPLMPRATCWVSWSFTKVSTLAWLVLTSI